MMTSCQYEFPTNDFKKQMPEKYKTEEIKVNYQNKTELLEKTICFSQHFKIINLESENEKMAKQELRPFSKKSRRYHSVIYFMPLLRPPLDQMIEMY